MRRHNTQAGPGRVLLGQHNIRFSRGCPRLRPGCGVGALQPQQVEGHVVGGPLFGEPGRAGTSPLEAALEPLEGQPAGVPYDHLPVQGRGVGELDRAGAQLKEALESGPHPCVSAAPGARLPRTEALAIRPT